MTFPKIYKGMKVIIIENLNLILEIANGRLVIESISFVDVKWTQKVVTMRPH
jgi:hypothetical protein